MMNSPRSIFDKHRYPGTTTPHGNTKQKSDPPYKRIEPGGLPPMCFQLRLRDGQRISYPYSDIRSIHCRDAGQIRITLLSTEKLAITITGRHLYELGSLLGMAVIRWIREADPRGEPRPEENAEVEQVLIETIPSG